MNYPLVSIIVRTKDRPTLVKKALKSIADQIYRPIEVVLVNDGGVDLNIQEIETILHDISLNYIRLENNMGRAHAGNVGLDNAVGEYIGFLDDDDELYHDHVLLLTKRLLSSSMKIAFTDAEIVSAEFKDGEIIEKSRHVLYSHEFSPGALLIQNYIPFMCLLFCRDVIKEVRFDETFEIFEDWMFLLQLSKKHWFDHIKKVTAKYVQWSDEAQINRRALLENFSKEAYKRVLDYNSDQISAEAIYTYCVFNATEKEKLFNELVKKETEYFQEKIELITELKKLRVEKLKLEVENKTLEDEKIEIENERNLLLQESKNLRNTMDEIKDSLSWKVINRYRSLKDTIAPTGTKRRGSYDLILKSIKVLSHEGFRGFLKRAKKKGRVYLKNMTYTTGFSRLRTMRCFSDPKSYDIFDFIQRPVYIIMPVYNGYECFMNCMESIFRYTDLIFNTLVIIDDKSSDDRIRKYLKTLKGHKEGRRIKILFNSKNIGFTRTVNKGMRLSPEDVILINSDTIVTNNWVNKLQRAAYSKPRIATATPLSNYVTINGIPKPFQFNSIPGGMDIHSFAEFLERISLRSYPEIPAGVGFCLYVKRGALDEIGYFDEKNFGKGYAEETDFCMRALKKGFVHILDDATYIYHVGGVSFESVKDPEILRKKNLMIEKNLETLKALHPEYAILLEKSLRENLAPVHSYINLRLQLLGENIESTVCHRSET